MSKRYNIDSVPDNSNFLQTTKYTFVIPNLSFARYFCQAVTMPGVSTGEVTIATPFVDTYRHGDKLVYEPLSLTFLVDEDLKTWEESYNWLVSLTFPQRFGQYRNIKAEKTEAYYDGVLTINTNANIPNMRIKFAGCYPTALTGIDFSSADSADVTPTATITFRYNYYTIERF